MNVMQFDWIQLDQISLFVVSFSCSSSLEKKNTESQKCTDVPSICQFTNKLVLSRGDELSWIIKYNPSPLLLSFLSSFFICFSLLSLNLNSLFTTFSFPPPLFHLFLQNLHNLGD